MDTETAGEGGDQLSKKGIAEATNTLDLQGTINYSDRNPLGLQK